MVSYVSSFSSRSRAHVVLIFVVVDDGLVPGEVDLVPVSVTVLILVVVDDGLVRHKRVQVVMT